MQDPRFIFFQFCHGLLCLCCRPSASSTKKFPRPHDLFFFSFHNPKTFLVAILHPLSVLLLLDLLLPALSHHVFKQHLHRDANHTCLHYLPTPAAPCTLRQYQQQPLCHQQRGPCRPSLDLRASTGTSSLAAHGTIFPPALSSPPIFLVLLLNLHLVPRRY